MLGAPDEADLGLIAAVVVVPPGTVAVADRVREMLNALTADSSESDKSRHVEDGGLVGGTCSVAGRAACTGEPGADGGATTAEATSMTDQPDMRCAPECSSPTPKKG